MLGAQSVYVDVTFFTTPPIPSARFFALAGMGAVFAGIIRAPMTSVLIIFEMTGSYGLVLPLMIANMSAYALAATGVTRPIYEALLETGWCPLAPWQAVNPEEDTAEYTGEVRRSRHGAGGPRAT